MKIHYSIFEQNHIAILNLNKTKLGGTLTSGEAIAIRNSLMLSTEKFREVFAEKSLFMISLMIKRELSKNVTVSRISVRNEAVIKKVTKSK